MHGQTRKTVNPRINSMRERRTPGFHRSGRHHMHEALRGGGTRRQKHDLPLTVYRRRKRCLRGTGTANPVDGSCKAGDAPSGAPLMPSPQPLRALIAAKAAVRALTSFISSARPCSLLRYRAFTAEGRWSGMGWFDIITAIGEGQGVGGGG